MVTGGEGPRVEDLEEVHAHLWVVLGHREVLGDGGSTEQGGQRRAALVEGETGLGSFTGKGEARRVLDLGSGREEKRLHGKADERRRNGRRRRRSGRMGRG